MKAIKENTTTESNHRDTESTEFVGEVHFFASEVKKWTSIFFGSLPKKIKNFSLLCALCVSVVLFIA
ncbi:MAG TPA: hypothetical protein VLG76_04690 [Rhabdochlamydiaceae bacterium]|nr:hypothetical protein [Rhabdochlamydiaceae bacterium]